MDGQVEGQRLAAPRRKPVERGQERRPLAAPGRTDRTATASIFTHVAGHSGHPENERCDELAVAAYQQFLKR